MRGLLHVVVKEILQLRRDRSMIPALVVGPLVQLLLLGFAANSDVRDVPVVVVDQDRTSASRQLVERFRSSGLFRIAGTAEVATAIEPWLIDGRAEIALIIRAGYADALARGGRPEVQAIADGSDSRSATVGLGYAARIVERVGADLLASLAERRPGVVPRIGRTELAPRVWYNPDLLSRWFYVPAVLALTLMLTTMILPSMAVVREKEVGTLEQLSVTPVRPWQLILGKLLPFFVIGIVVLLLTAAAAHFVFGVPIRGSMPVLVVLSLPFLLTTLGLGLLASTLVRTQQQAMMASIFLMMLPMIYLSGLIFPIENMPYAIRQATYAVPLRYYSVILRGVLLRGSGIAVLWKEAAILLAFAAGALALASLRFRKSLD